jgi:hypothetical protein
MANHERKPRKFQCYGCSAPIYFDKNIRSKNGKHIPLNLDDTNHDCPNSKFNKNKSNIVPSTKSNTSAVA